MIQSVIKGVVTGTIRGLAGSGEGGGAAALTVLDSDGNSFTCGLAVLDSDGNSFTVTNAVLDSDANSFTVI